MEGTHEGLASARAQRLGRPAAMTPQPVRHARDLLTRPDNTVSSIARLVPAARPSTSTVPELTTTARPAIGQSAAELEADH